MDLDLHRQKRTRVGSAAARCEPSSNCDDQNEQAKPTRSRLSTITSAPQNLSFRDDQQSTQNSRQREAILGTTLRQTSQNPTPLGNFSGDPTFQHNGAPTSNFSFDPNINHHRLFGHPTPPPSFPSAAATTNNFQSQSHSKESQTEINTPSNVLPIHRSRPIQPFSGYFAGPSSKQAERDANHPPPQQAPAYSPRIVPRYQPTPSPMPQMNPQTATEQSKTLNHKLSRPRPIYLPTSEHGNTNTPFAWSNIPSSASLDTGRLLLDAHKETINSHQDFADVRKPVESMHPISGAKGHQQLPGNRLIGSTFPYPSIYPVNERRPYDTLELPHPRSPPGYPPNYYTSPNRIPNASYFASRKRKRGWPAVAPEAYIYTRTNNPNFNIFGGILLYPELCFALAANLRVEDLISLYAISKDFHTIIDTRFATVVLGQALRKCPESSRVFPFRCYKYLCRSDPAPRIPHPHIAKQAAGEIRNVPSFRWLRMVLYREKVCHEIMTIMAEDGVPLPSRCELSIKRMWFLMDVPDNARRIGYMHTKKLVTDLDLYFIMCLIVKLDLRFNDPNAPNRYHGLRKIILAQQGLVPLWRALNRSTLLTRYDVFKMWIAAKHNPPPEEEGLPMFGVPGDWVGKTRMEYFGKKSTHDTGKPCTFLLRPDQLVMREIIRRKIVFSRHFLRCLLWGYVDIVTMENYPPRTWDRRINGLDEEYEHDDECGRHGKADDEKDDLLDLGITKPISILVKQNNKATDERVRRRDDAFLEECMRWFENESKEVSVDSVN